jgi:osmotically-inducible protein OsmY
MLRQIVDQDADRSIDLQVKGDDPRSLVAARLRRSGYAFLSSVQCDVRDGVAFLTGTVPTFHLKQIAQELASHTPGVWQVNNRLHVPRSTYRARRSAK